MFLKYTLFEISASLGNDLYIFVQGHNTYNNILTRLLSSCERALCSFSRRSASFSMPRDRSAVFVITSESSDP